MTKIKSVSLALLFSISLFSVSAVAKDLRIPLPKRSHPTPVQKLNQAGVKALNRNKIEAAQKIFFKAYLIDPNDPFTLNNLGYIAELQGDVDRAQKFYELASQNATDAVVEKSTNHELIGKTLAQVAGKADGGPLEVNRLNVQAIGLLQKDRALEAQAILQKALKLDPNNPFSLNNMGFVEEKQGEFEKAQQYYNQAANTNSQEKIVVTTDENHGWRGRSISEVARSNAKKIAKALNSEESVDAKVARLNLRGVSALNRNDRSQARRFFEEANKLDPNNAFSLNNMGYLAELDGDRETANYYYDKAQQADNSGSRVGVATRPEAEGKKLARVADTNEIVVDSAMQSDAQAKKLIRQAPVLKRRDNTVVKPGAASPPVAK